MFSIHAVSLIVATFISKAKWQIFEGGMDLSGGWSGSHYFWYVKTKNILRMWWMGCVATFL